MSKAEKTARRVTKEDAEIGFRIRQVRQNKRITQSEVASQCGITYQQLQKYELGRNRLTVGMLIQIAKVLEVDPGGLLKSASDKNSAALVNGGLPQDIDKAAASLWNKIDSDRHKYALFEIMDLLFDPASMQPQDMQKRE